MEEKEVIVETMEEVNCNCNCHCNCINEVLGATAKAFEDCCDAVEEKVNDVLVATAKGVEDCCDAVEEKMEDFKEVLTETEVIKSVETSMEEVNASLKKVESKLKKIKTEEIMEEVKPRLRRETFENSSLLRRVGERQFLLILLVIAQVLRKMLMLYKIVAHPLFLCLDDCDPADARLALPGNCSTSSTCCG